MTSVFIDGVEYTPKMGVPDITSNRIKSALESLTEIQYFHECTNKHRAWAWDAMNAISPDLAKISADNPQAAYDLIQGEDDD